MQATWFKGIGGTALVVVGGLVGDQLAGGLLGEQLAGDQLVGGLLATGQLELLGLPDRPLPSVGCC